MICLCVNLGGRHEDVHTKPASSPSPPFSDRKFTINGAITDLTRDTYFYDDPAPLNETTLQLPLVRTGKYVMMFGPRAAGKSTCMLRAYEQLGQDFFVKW
jgi:hypothetical protein